MNILDSIISFISPEAGIRRAQARASLQQISKFMGTGRGPYSAANLNRLNAIRGPISKENDVSQDRLNFLRSQSWDLYRDNPTCRKIIRSLESKVIGKGMHPESTAMRVDGTPHVEFRARAMQLWEELQSGFDSRGLPGKGGLTMGCQQRLALKNTILSGDCLYRIKPITEAEQRRRGLPVPIVLQLVDSCRLAHESEIPSNKVADGNTLFKGIEFGPQGDRQAYWVKDTQITDPAATTATATRVPVAKMGHLFVEEDIDQCRGVPWLAAAILRARRTDDLEYNVLTASSMASCVVAAFSKPTGAAKFGLNQSADPSPGTADGTDLTDSDGNTINKIQPGMVINKGKDGSFELLSPNQPNMNPEAFVQHLQRGTASAVPGTKSSTVTGDYRNSSFSSERSADNDTWPEIAIVQEWFSSQFCQPIWETVLRTAILEGYFDGIVSTEEFQASPGRFCAANWQGPIALSINPRDDAEAAHTRVKIGVSSPQMECAKVNTDWRLVLNDFAELYAVAREKGIPDAVVNNMLGVDAQDQLAAAAVAQQSIANQETANVA